MVPLFIFWVAACNVAAILLISFTFEVVWKLVIVLIINILSLILLYPLFGSRPLKPFVGSATIWFVATAVVYLVIGTFWILIPGTIQALGDVWFNRELKRRM